MDQLWGTENKDQDIYCIFQRARWRDVHEPGPGDHLAPGEVLRAEAELLHQLRLQHRDILLLPSLHRHGDIIDLDRYHKHFYLTHNFLQVDFNGAEASADNKNRGFSIDYRQIKC